RKKQMRHARKIGNVLLAIDCLAQRDRQLRFRLLKLWRFHDVPNKYPLAMMVGDFDADRRFAGYSVDTNRLSLQCKTQIVAQTDHAAILNSRIGFELDR